VTAAGATVTGGEEDACFVRFARSFRWPTRVPGSNGEHRRPGPWIREHADLAQAAFGGIGRGVAGGGRCLWLRTDHGDPPVGRGTPGRRLHSRLTWARRAGSAWTGASDVLLDGFARQHERAAFSWPPLRFPWAPSRDIRYRGFSRFEGIAAGRRPGCDHLFQDHWVEKSPNPQAGHGPDGGASARRRRAKRSSADRHAGRT